MARLTAVLAREHEELLKLLDRCLTADGGVDARLYDEFRTRQLKHLAIEEQVLVRLLRERGGLPSEFQNGIRRDHEAVAVFCVTAPEPDFVHDLRDLLAWHHRVEEGPAGLYPLFDGLDVDDAVLERALAAVTPVPLPPLGRGPAVARLLRQVRRDVGLEERRRG